SRAEAEAYVNNPVLGPRLRECTRLVNLVQGSSIEEIFGYPDDLTFRSSMSLFSFATTDIGVFKEALQTYLDVEFDSFYMNTVKYAFNDRADALLTCR